MPLFLHMQKGGFLTMGLIYEPVVYQLFKGTAHCGIKLARTASYFNKCIRTA